MYFIFVTFPYLHTFLGMNLLLFAKKLCFTAYVAKKLCFTAYVAKKLCFTAYVAKNMLDSICCKKNALQHMLQKIMLYCICCKWEKLKKNFRDKVQFGLRRSSAWAWFISLSEQSSFSLFLESKLVKEGDNKGNTSYLVITKVIQSLSGTDCQYHLFECNCK